MPKPAGKNPDNTILRPQQFNVTNPIIFTCVALSPEEVETATRHYTEVFVRDEPTTRRYGIIEDVLIYQSPASLVTPVQNPIPR